jgi:hypothetical protein
MKAFSGSSRTEVRLAGLILLLTEKLVVSEEGCVPLVDATTRPPNDRDEHSQTDILTPGLKPRSRLPGLIASGCESL